MANRTSSAISSGYVRVPDNDRLLLAANQNTPSDSPTVPMLRQSNQPYVNSVELIQATAPVHGNPYGRNAVEDDERKSDSTSISNNSIGSFPLPVVSGYQTLFRISPNLRLEIDKTYENVSNFFEIGEYISRGSFAGVYAGWYKDPLHRYANRPEFFIGETVMAKRSDSKQLRNEYLYYRGVIVKEYSDGNSERKCDVKFSDNKVFKGIQGTEIHKGFAIRCQFMKPNQDLKNEIKVVDKLMDLNKSLKDLNKDLNKSHVIEHFAYYFKQHENNDLYYYEIMELGNSNLKDVLDSMSGQGSFTEKEVWNFTIQMASQLISFNNNNILHRDIKPENIIVKKDRADHYSYYHCDFGSAKITENDSTVTQHSAGTPLYMAPELLTEKRRSGKTDIWAVGCILHEMLTGKNVWAHINTPIEMWQKLRMLREDLKIPDTCVGSKSFINIVEQLLIVNPVERISADILLNRLKNNCKTLLEEQNEKENIIRRLQQQERNCGFKTLIFILILVLMAGWYYFRGNIFFHDNGICFKKDLEINSLVPNPYRVVREYKWYKMNEKGYAGSGTHKGKQYFLVAWKGSANYEVPKKRSVEACVALNARVGTKEEMIFFQENDGAQWCACSHVADGGVSSYYPMQSGGGEGCGGALAGVRTCGSNNQNVFCVRDPKRKPAMLFIYDLVILKTGFVFRFFNGLSLRNSISLFFLQKI